MDEKTKIEWRIVPTWAVEQLMIDGRWHRQAGGYTSEDAARKEAGEYLGPENEQKSS